MSTPPMQTRLLAGRYRLLQQLGRGGMGVVWQARDEVLGRDVAVKEVLLPPELTDEEGQLLRRRTMREARSAARLNHANVVAVFDVVEEEGRPWVVMEFVQSRSLGEIVRESGPLPPAQVADIGLQLLAALEVAHAAGVLHRDVKPSNVLIAEDGRVVLTDFGIATLEGDPSLTTSGMLLGSPAYIAPERAQAHGAGPESDLWSLGATLYTAVEGRPPYDRGAALPTLAAVVTDEPDPPRLAGSLWPVLDGLLRKNPAERIGAAEAERLLQEAAAMPSQDQPGLDPPPPATTVQAGGTSDHGERTRVLRSHQLPLVGRAAGRSHPRWLAAGSALIVLTGALLTWNALSRDEDPEQGGQPPAQQSPRSVSSPASNPASPSPRPTSQASRTTLPPVTTKPPSSPRTPDASAALPAGFERYRDRTGFSLAVPGNWNMTRQGTSVYFREPDGSRLLIVDQTDDPHEDPVADWQQQEQARRNGYPDYRRIRIAAVDYFQKAADWEFTYAGRNGRVHVLIRGTVTSDDQAYGIYWSTPDGQWQENLHYFRAFTETFRPAP